MSQTVVWLTGGLLLPIVGAPLLTHRSYRAFPPAARAVLAGAAGAVLLSFSMTVFALLGASWNPIALLAVAAAEALLLRALLGRSAAVPELPSSVAAESRAAAVLSGAAVAIALAGTLAGAAGSSDLLLFWGPKARAFAAARTIDVRFLTDSHNWYMHPYYPPLVTNLDAFETRLAGALPWTAAALTFPLLLGALAVALPAVLRRADRPLAAPSTSAVVVSALGLLGMEANVAGNADPFLWFFEVLGIALLLGSKDDSSRLLLAGLLLAGAASAKVEGLPFLLASLFLVAIARSGARARSLTLLAAPSVAALGIWFAFGRVRHAFTGYGEYGSLRNVRWDRLELVLHAIARALRDAGHGLPFLVPLAVFLVLLGLRGRIRVLPLGVAAALGGFLSVVYLSDVPDPLPWIGWSAARTFAPIGALLAMAVAAPATMGARR